MPALNARIEEQRPGTVDWTRAEPQLVARGRQVVAEGDHGLPEGPRPVLWAYFEALRRGLSFADEPAPWAQDAPPPQRPVTVADRDAYRYLWPRFVRAMLARPDLGELLREPLRLRWEAERVFEELRAALDTAMEIRQGHQTMEAVARYFPQRLATVQELLAELARRDEATPGRDKTRAPLQNRRLWV